MQFPNFPEKYFFHFVRGYFDGDGNVHESQGSLYIKFSSTSRKFIHTLKQELKTLGIISSVYVGDNHGTPIYILNVLSKNRAGFSHHIYQDATIFLERKQKIFEQYFAKPTIECRVCGSKFKKRGNRKHCEFCIRSRK
jgi:intein-encoded DNA endonuclease-like protein